MSNQPILQHQMGWLVVYDLMAQNRFRDMLRHPLNNRYILLAIRETSLSHFTLYLSHFTSLLHFVILSTETIFNMF